MIATERRFEPAGASHELSQLRAERLLPGLGFAAIAGAESKLPSAARTDARVRDWVESPVSKICRSPPLTADMAGLTGFARRASSLRKRSFRQPLVRVHDEKADHGCGNLQSLRSIALAKDVGCVWIVPRGF